MFSEVFKRVFRGFYILEICVHEVINGYPRPLIVGEFGIGGF